MLLLALMICAVTGVGLVLLSAVGYGMTPILLKFAYAEGAQMEQILYYRFLLAVLFLLALLAAKNIDAPWTRAAVEGVERALTMKIDLDQSLGSLSFVRDLMPESMLVFFDLSAEGALAAPVDGEMDKAFDQQRPWVEFACEPGADVFAAEAGTVLAVTQLSGGGWGVMIDHGNGLETVSAYLLEPQVEAGQSVERGQVIARSEAGRLYFEARQSGELIDPASLLRA